MSLATGLTLKFDGATPLIQKILADTQPAVLGQWIGTAGKKLFQTHLLSLGRNKRGWPTTNFWSRAAKSTTFAVTGTGVVWSINQQGVRQRYFGGRIAARNKKMLTIPMGPESYGKVASDFPAAFVLRTKKGAFLVQQGMAHSVKSKKLVKVTGKGFKPKRVSALLEFLFKLVPFVDQAPNPNVLPAPDIIANTVSAEIVRNLNARFGKP